MSKDVHDKRSNGTITAYSPSSRSISAHESPTEEAHEYANFDRSSDGTIEARDVIVGSSSHIPMTLPAQQQAFEVSPDARNHRALELSQPSTQRLSAANLHRSQQDLACTIPQTNASERLGDSASVVSTMPPELWEELQHMKARLNQLETLPTRSSVSPQSNLGSRQPGFAISPRSAHSSYSFRGPGSETVFQSQSSSSNHPLLRTSLTRLNDSLIPTEILRPVDMAVSDALVLAGLSLDRNGRKRADALCRSLTELCLTLYEQYQHESLPARDRLPVRNGMTRSNTMNNGHYRGFSGDSRYSTRPGAARSLQGNRFEHNRDYPASTSNHTPNHTRDHMHHHDDAQSTTSFHDRSDRAPLSRARLEQNYDTRRQHTFDFSEPRASGNRRSSTLGELSDTGSISGDRQDRNASGNGLGHIRTSSRAVTEILDRSPVTRESLYARYQKRQVEERRLSPHGDEPRPNMLRYSPSRRLDDQDTGTGMLRR